MECPFNLDSRSHVDLTVLPTPALDAELSEIKVPIGRPARFPCKFPGHATRFVGSSCGPEGACTWISCYLQHSLLAGQARLHNFHTNNSVSGRLDQGISRFLDGELSPYARRLSLGLLHGAMSVPGHLCQVLRCRLLKQPAAASR